MKRHTVTEKRWALAHANSGEVYHLCHRGETRKHIDKVFSLHGVRLVRVTLTYEVKP